MKNLNVDQSITRSIRRNEIVTEVFDANDTRELIERAIGYADVREQYGYVETWGEHDGSGWRIHAIISANINIL